MNPTSLSLAEIESLIPHRAPFAFLRSAVVVSDKGIEGDAIWEKGHPVFDGHFPGRPVVPGVLQIEAAAQLAGVLIGFLHRHEPKADVQDTASLGVLASVRKSEFHAVLQHDEVLALSVEMRQLNASSFLCGAEGRRGDQLVVRTEFLIALKPVAAEQGRQEALTSSPVHA